MRVYLFDDRSVFSRCVSGLDAAGVLTPGVFWDVWGVSGCVLGGGGGVRSAGHAGHFLHQGASQDAQHPAGTWATTERERETERNVVTGAHGARV
jgi:hypothetical protein